MIKHCYLSMNFQLLFFVYGVLNYVNSQIN